MSLLLEPYMVLDFPRSWLLDPVTEFEPTKLVVGLEFSTVFHFDR